MIATRSQVLGSTPPPPPRDSNPGSATDSPLCPAPVRPGCLFRLFLSLLSPSSQPPIDRVSPNVALKLVTKPILFEPAEWSERLTPGQSGWLGTAAVGSIPALALSLFLQHLNFLLFLQRLYLSLRAVRSAAILLFVLCRFVLAASSACFFPFFLPPPNPQSTKSVRT